MVIVRTATGWIIPGLEKYQETAIIHHAIIHQAILRHGIHHNGMNLAGIIVSNRKEIIIRKEAIRKEITRKEIIQGAITQKEIVLKGIRHNETPLKGIIRKGIHRKGIMGKEGRKTALNNTRLNKGESRSEWKDRKGQISTGRHHLQEGKMIPGGQNAG